MNNNNNNNNNNMTLFINMTFLIQPLNIKTVTLWEMAK